MAKASWSAPVRLRHMTNNSSTATPSVLTVGDGSTNIFAGVIADGTGTMALSVSGVSGNTSIVTLTGTSNAYSGGTTIGAGGQLFIGDSATSPGSLPGNVVISSTTAGTLTFNTPSGMSITASGNMSGSGGLAKTGAGFLILTGNNSYSGSTAVNQGTLEAASATALPLSGPVSVAGGAVLAVRTSGGGSGWSSTQIGSVLADVAWSNSAAAFGIDTTNGNFTYGGNITQALGLIKLGANVLALTGTNTYSAQRPSVPARWRPPVRDHCRATTCQAESAWPQTPASLCKPAMAQPVGAAPRSAACWPTSPGPTPRPSASIRPTAISRTAETSRRP